jgi:RPA family protein
METKNKLIRKVAVKAVISEILKSTFVQSKEDEPSYLLTTNNEKIFRINLISIIVDKEIQGSITNMLIDDGTEKIILRSFEDNKIIKNLNIGDVILIIGKLRSYNNEKYLSPEIIKKVNKLWLKVRALELKEFFNGNNSIKIEIVTENEKIEENDNKKILIDEDKDNDEIIEDDEMLPMQKIAKIIKENDQGEGVLIEEIIEKSSLNDTEKLIEIMLEKGDIFQNLPGRIKVL